MSKPDGFLGSWLVSEYVYNPDGSFAGIVRQTRRLQQLDEGRIRIEQHCEPDEQLHGHAMAAFKGDWAFDIQVEGRTRRYLGPDVVGSGLGWGEGVMMGRGLWPRFGHNFTSFSFLPQPERQVTGGVFSKASEIVANIVGLAVPQESAQGWPEFAEPHLPADLASEWHGTMRSYASDGELLEEKTIHRNYASPLNWQDASQELELVNDSKYWRVGGELDGQHVVGFATRSNWLQEMRLQCGPELAIENMEVLDSGGGLLLALQRRWRDEQLAQVDVLHLRPDTE